MREAESGQRGYLLTGDEAFLASYLVVSDRARGDVGELQRLTSTSFARDHLEAVAPLVDARLAAMAQVVERRRNQGVSAAQEASV